MILRKLTLCPFAGFTHREVEFQLGLNVILGENEAGKSTLVRALKASLFEPTNLGKRDLEKFAHAYFPKGIADQAKTILVFESGNITYTLEKIWGAGKSSKLTSSEGASLNDDSAVQVKLNELLVLHRGSWEEVLFADQQKMSYTVDSIQKNKDNINRIPTLEGLGGGLDGDLPAQDLLSSLQSLMTEYKLLWDFTARGPKDNKGIQNPWQRGLGFILKAYYEAEKVRAQFNSLKELEVELDNTSTLIKNNNTDLKERKASIDAMKLQQQNVLQQQELSNQKNMLEGQLAAMKSVMNDWPTKNAAQPLLEKNIKAITDRITNLELESKNAQRRNEGASTVDRYRQLQEILTSVEEIKTRLASNGNIDPVDVKQVLEHRQALTQDHLELKAQKLEAEIHSSSEITIQTAQGSSPIEKIGMKAGETKQIEASGKVSFEWNGVKISVKSALKPVDDIVDSIEIHEEAIASILDKYGLKSLAEFDQVLQKNKADNDLLNECRSNFSGITKEAKKSYEQIKEQAEELLAIPSTRSLDEIQTAYRTESSALSEATVEFNGNKDQIELWEKTYIDLGYLSAGYSKTQTTYDNLIEQINAIPPLPDGFENAADYIQQLNELIEVQESQTESNNHLINHLTRIQTQLDNFDTDALSLETQLESLQSKFERKLQEYKALELAERKLKEIIEHNPHNPFADFETETASLFASLTGNRYTEILREGEAPVAVKNNNNEIPTDLLSGGTAASLGLAVRLAYAKLYLKNLDGFFVLDDPFTEMDEERRLLATQTLTQFAAEKQTFFFTCHPVHAQSFLHANPVILHKN
jgi:exonuclease SbcC